MGARRRIVNWLRWPYSVAVLSLGENERVVLDSVSSLVRVLLPTQGRLVLTTERLIYIPWYLRILPRWLLGWSRVEIDLSQIRSVDRRSWFRGLWGGLPGLPLFSVCLEDGSTHTFQVFFAGYWRRDIEKLIEPHRPRPQRDPSGT